MNTNQESASDDIVTIIRNGNERVNANGNIDYSKLKAPFYLKKKSKKHNVPPSPQFKDKNVLLLGSPDFQYISNLEAFRSFGFKRFVQLYRKKQQWISHYFDDFICAESEILDKKEETLEAVKKFMKEKNLTFDAVITISEYAMTMTAYISEKLNLKGIPFDYSLKMRNKYECRQECIRLGIPHVKHFLIKYDQRQNYIDKLKSVLDDIKTKNQNIAEATPKIMQDLFAVQLPCILKLAYGWGKDFVRLVKTVTELLEQLEISMSIEDWPQCPLHLTLEEYYDGHEIDFDFLVANNKLVFIAICDNDPQDPPYFLEAGGKSVSYILSAEEMSYLEKEVAEWVSKLNYGDAVLHMDAKCKPKSMFGNAAYLEGGIINKEKFVVPIEINQRLGGGDTFSTVETTHGVNMLQEYMNICFGIPLDEARLLHATRNPLYRSVNRYYLCGTGHLKFLDVDFKRLIETSDVREVNIYHGEGDKIEYIYYICYIALRANLGTSFDEITELMNSYSNVIKGEIS